MSSPSDPSLQNEVFGPYLVYERLGVGGMATVHRAKERGIEGFERIVALKRLLPHLAEDASFVKSFVREAKLASMLQHANIVQLYELGRVGTTYFISMEHIDGRDVRRILRQARKVTGPPNINVTLAMLIQLCDALEYAHTRHDEHGEPLGLVHRDVSPSNLLVTKSGHLKVIDFGIAKAQSQQLRTQTGRVKGKLAYMAPEAISGKELDSRSDIFSVGVIAHELLTARPLFASKNEYQTLINVQRSEILPPSAFNQAVPPELDAIVLRALAREPDERYHSAAEMRDDLHGVRIRYQLSATNREVQTWCDWAFSLEAPGGNFSGPAVTDSLAGVSRSPIRTPLPLRAATSEPAMPAMRVRASSSPPHAGEEEEAADVAWGGGQEHDSGQPVVLDDVPEISGNFPRTGTGPHAVRAGTAGGLAHAIDHGFSDHDPAAASTMVGLGAPSQRAGSAPDSWPHGSSNDVVRKRAHRSSSIPPGGADGAVGSHLGADETTRNPRAESPAFGAALVEKKGPGAKIALIALLVLAVLGAGAFALFGRGDKDKPKAAVAAPASLPATLKFIVEPADATIKIAGMDPHVGAPWAVPLDPGVVQIKISRDGHQSWETSVELSSAETQTIRVVLGVAEGDANMATLALGSEPTGMTVLLDGQELQQKTPLKMQIAAGPHHISLRQNGEVQWKHSFQAEARTLYEFNPSMSAIKQKERELRERQIAAAHERTSAAPPRAEPRQAERAPAPPPPAPGSAVASAVPPPAAPVPGPGSAAATGRPPTPPVAPTGSGGPGSGAATARASATLPGPGTAKPADVKPPPVPTVVRQPNTSATPVVVPPNAVKRTSGDLPKISTIVRPGQEVPKNLSAKICIDAGGTVTSVQVFKVTGELATKMAAAIRDWRYTTHKVDGRAVPACFVNSFQLK